MSKQQTVIAMLVAVAAIAIGSLGTWATLGGLISVNGTEGDGVLTLIGAGLALFCIWRYAEGSEGMLVGLVLIGLGCGAISIYHIVDIPNAIDSEPFSEAVGVGWGLWLDAIGSVALVVLALITLRAEPEPATEGDAPRPAREKDDAGR